MEAERPELNSDLSDALTLAPLDFDIPASLVGDLRRFARRSKRFRKVWLTLSPPETATAETDARAADAALTALVHDAVALAYPEELGRCPTLYLIWQLELSDASFSVLEAIIDTLERGELATTKTHLWGDMWSSRVRAWRFTGELAVPTSTSF